MSNKVLPNNNASSASPEPLTLRELLRSWLEEAEPLEKAHEGSGRGCLN